MIDEREFDDFLFFFSRMVFELSPISFVLEEHNEDDRRSQFEEEQRTVSCSILRVCEIQ